MARALYSVPGKLIGRRLVARADHATVKLFWRGQLIKVHPRQPPGRRHTDPADLPPAVAAYALRDVDTLARRAAAHGPAIGAYAAAVLDHPLPRTKMRQVYRLLGLVRRHGADRVELACQRALDAEAVNVGLIERMLARGLETGGQPPPSDPCPGPSQPPGPPTVVPVAGRFVRDAVEFAPPHPRGRPADAAAVLSSPARPARPRSTSGPGPQRIEVSAQLRDLMRRLKLGRLLDTLPERLALARTQQLHHHDFLEMLLADEVTRRDQQAAVLRARAAHLDPTMVLDAWDDTSPVAFDGALWAELCSLRFLADAHNVLIMGPVGVGKTFLANALGHAAVRRRYSVHVERADKLFKRLRAARLDHSYDEEMRKLHRVELLILDDLALHPLGVDRPATSTSSSSNATGRPPRSSPRTGSRRRCCP